MVYDLERILRDCARLQIVLKQPQCSSRKQFHDLYLERMDFVKNHGIADDYWALVEWYDSYTFEQAKIKDEHIHYNSFN
jgi:hypothetical protein